MLFQIKILMQGADGLSYPGIVIGNAFNTCLIVAFPVGIFKALFYATGDFAKQRKVPVKTVKDGLRNFQGLI